MTFQKIPRNKQKSSIIWYIFLTLTFGLFSSLFFRQSNRLKMILMWNCLITISRTLSVSKSYEVNLGSFVLYNKLWDNICFEFVLLQNQIRKFGLNHSHLRKSFNYCHSFIYCFPFLILGSNWNYYHSCTLIWPI